MSIVRLCAALPNNRTAEILGRQLLKSGTSPGAHFREALRARSKSEYVAKLNGGLMELEEAAYWLELLVGANLVSPIRESTLHREAEELSAIFVALINKWKNR